MVNHRRDPWSQHEDSWLMSLVHRNGPHNWVRISQEIQTRSPKQCRERYHQALKPTLNHEPITPEEGEQIERLVQEMGKRWAEIARRLKERSDNQVKDWWYGGHNGNKHNRDSAYETPIEEIKEPDRTLLHHYPVNQLNVEDSRHLGSHIDSGYGSAPCKSQILEMSEALLPGDTGTIYTQELDLNSTMRDGYVDEFARLIFEGLGSGFLASPLTDKIFTCLEHLLTSFALRLEHNASSKEMIISMVFIYRHRR
jgi:Myb-like DNA-binding domain